MNNVKNIRIREAQHPEHPEITDISIRIWKQAYRGLIEDEFLDNLSAEEWLKGRIQWFSEHDDFSIVAVYKEQIIGFSDFGISRHPKYGKGEIYAIYVLPEYQGYGVGKLLMREAIRQLQQKNMIPYIVITLENNIPAQKFYESIGFHFTDKVLSCIGESDYIENVYVNYP
jgi:ribosomal protein S18 acetylase RimI-like enzyme